MKLFGCCEIVTLRDSKESNTTLNEANYAALSQRFWRDILKNARKKSSLLCGTYKLVRGLGLDRENMKNRYF